jgi:hypothetical protein
MRRLAILVAVALSTTGCGWFDDPAPDSARVTIQGETGKTVRLIVSSKFIATINQTGQTRVVIVEADTSIVTVPFSAAYRIDDDQRFFAETTRLDTDLQTVRMQVFLDSKKEFDEGGSLLQGGQPFRFIYMFNQAVTRDVVVL